MQSSRPGDLCRPESQPHPGLHTKSTVTSRSREGIHPLYSTRETPHGALHPALGPPALEGPAGGSPEEDTEMLRGWNTFSVGTD